MNELEETEIVQWWEDTLNTPHYLCGVCRKYHQTPAEEKACKSTKQEKTSMSLKEIIEVSAAILKEHFESKERCLAEWAKQQTPVNRHPSEEHNLRLINSLAVIIMEKNG